MNKKLLVLLFLMPLMLYGMEEEHTFEQESSSQKSQDQKEFEESLKAASRHDWYFFDKSKLQQLKTDARLATFDPQEQKRLKKEIDQKIANAFYELNMPSLIGNCGNFEAILEKESLESQGYDQEMIDEIHRLVIEQIVFINEQEVNMRNSAKESNYPGNGNGLIKILKILISDNVAFLLKKKPEHIAKIFDPIVQNQEIPTAPKRDGEFFRCNNDETIKNEFLQFYIDEVKLQLRLLIKAGTITPHDIFCFRALKGDPSHPQNKSRKYKGTLFSEEEKRELKTLKEIPYGLQSLVSICKDVVKKDLEEKRASGTISELEKLIKKLSSSHSELIKDWLREWDATTEPKNTFSRKENINADQILFKLSLDNATKDNATKNWKTGRLIELTKDPILTTFSPDQQEIIQSLIQKNIDPKKAAKYFIKNHIKPQLNNNKPFDSNFLDETHLQDKGYNDPKTISITLTKIEKYYKKNLIDPEFFSHRFKRLLSITHQRNLTEEILAGTDNQINKNIFQYSRTQAAMKRTQLALKIFAMQRKKQQRSEFIDFITKNHQPPHIFANNEIEQISIKNIEKALAIPQIESGTAIQVFGSN